MLMIFGVATITGGAVLTALAGLLFANETLSPRLRRFLGSQTFGVILASLMGTGLIMVFSFIAGGKPEVPALAAVPISIIVAVAGYAAIRLISRRAAALAYEAETPMSAEALGGLAATPPMGPAPTAHPGKRAA